MALRTQRRLPPFGAIVTGYRPEAGAEMADALRDLLAEHGLVVLRGQRAPSDVEIEALLRPLGTLTSETEEGRAHFEGLGKSTPSLIEDDSGRVGRRFNIANGPVGDGVKRINRGIGASELNWHNDQAHLPRLKTISCLEAVSFEAGAGNTFFCNMYQAAERLDPSWRARLDAMEALHDLSRYPAAPDAPPRPSVVRPVLLPHPDTGRICLYVNPSFTNRIGGLDAEESAALLERLFAHAYARSHVYEHAWREGDIAIWDNVGVQHMRPGLDPAKRRILRAFQGISERQAQVA